MFSWQSIKLEVRKIAKKKKSLLQTRHKPFISFRYRYFIKYFMDMNKKQRLYLERLISLGENDS